MHTTLVRMLRRELNDLPSAVQWSRLAGLTHLALDALLLQQKYHNIQQRTQRALWDQNHSLHSDVQELAKALKYYLDKDPSKDDIKQSWEQLIDKALKDLDTGYSLATNHDQEEES